MVVQEVEVCQAEQVRCPDGSLRSCRGMKSGNGDGSDRWSRSDGVFAPSCSYATAMILVSMKKKISGNLERLEILLTSDCPWCWKHALISSFSWG